MTATTTIRFRLLRGSAEGKVMELVDVSCEMEPEIIRGATVLHPDPDWPWPGANGTYRGVDRCVGFRLQPDHGLRALRLLPQPFLLEGWSQNRDWKSDVEYPWFHFGYACAHVHGEEIRCSEGPEAYVAVTDDGEAIELGRIGGFFLTRHGPMERKVTA